MQRNKGGLGRDYTFLVSISTSDREGMLTTEDEI